MSNFKNNFIFLFIGIVFIFLASSCSNKETDPIDISQAQPYSIINIEDFVAPPGRERKRITINSELAKTDVQRIHTVVKAAFNYVKYNKDVYELDVFLENEYMRENGYIGIAIARYYPHKERAWGYKKPYTLEVSIAKNQTISDFTKLGLFAPPNERVLKIPRKKIKKIDMTFNFKFSKHDNYKPLYRNQTGKTLKLVFQSSLEHSFEERAESAAALVSYYAYKVPEYSTSVNKINVALYEAPTSKNNFNKLVNEFRSEMKIFKVAEAKIDKTVTYDYDYDLEGKEFIYIYALSGPMQTIEQRGDKPPHLTDYNPNNIYKMKATY